jgi:hypothetical protein
MRSTPSSAQLRAMSVAFDALQRGDELRDAELRQRARAAKLKNVGH